MNKTSMVRRTDDARQARVPLTQSGQAAASNIKHAPLLLPVDANGPIGPRRLWPRPCPVRAIRCAMSVNALSHKDARPLRSATSRPRPRAQASWLAPKQRACWPGGAVPHPKATPHGPSRCWRTNSSRSRWGRLSLMPRSAGHAKQ